MQKIIALSGLYGITESTLMPDDSTLISYTEKAIKGGMAIVQYRCKNTSFEKQRYQASLLLKLCRLYNIPLLINDNVELAKEIHADGVHIGQNDMPLQEARKMLGSDAIIGITCGSSLQMAIEAENNGANYVAFGRFFPSKTKPEAIPAPLSVLTKAKEQCRLPVVAIGGITPENCTQVLQAGADILAVANGLFATLNIEERAKLFSDCCDRYNEKQLI